MFSFKFFCLVAFTISTVVSAKEDGRIVGGQIIKFSQAPYTMQIRYNGGTMCGGALVTPLHVVTAAHCIGSKEGLTVVGDADSISGKGIERKVINLIKHHGYTEANAWNNDVAVLKLDKPMIGGSIKPINLCTRPWNAGESFQVNGWGLTTEDGQVSPYLRTVFLRTISHEDCQAKYNMDRKNSDAKECAFALRKDACQGDSGGPGVMRGELCGIVSAGSGCANPKYPGIYTSVLKVRTFITRAIQTL